MLIHGKENPIMEEIDDLEQEFIDDLPKYDFRAHKNWSWWKYIDYFRWIVNAAIFGVPFSALSLVSIGWNLWFNIELNNFWAQGNLFLVFNTLYLLMQAFLSVWLIFEIPIWLRHFKVLRVFSLFSAFWYNVAYLLFIIEYYYTMYLTREKDVSELHPFEILEILFYAYNTMIHWPIPIINFVIMLKEFSMEFFQFLNRQAGSQRDDISLGFTNTYLAFIDLLWYFNPLSWSQLWNKFMK